jgi:hypothetical protein
LLWPHFNHPLNLGIFGDNASVLFSKSWSVRFLHRVSFDLRSFRLSGLPWTCKPVVVQSDNAAPRRFSVTSERRLSPQRNIKCVRHTLLCAVATPGVALTAFYSFRWTLGYLVITLSCLWQILKRSLPSPCILRPQELSAFQPSMNLQTGGLAVW